VLGFRYYTKENTVRVNSNDNFFLSLLEIGTLIFNFKKGQYRRADIIEGQIIYRYHNNYMFSQIYRCISSPTLLQVYNIAVIRFNSAGRRGKMRKRE